MRPARFCQEADPFVARQHGSKRGPLSPASASRAAKQNRRTSGELFRRASERIFLVVGVLVNSGLPELYPPEQQIINYERMRCGSTWALYVRHSLPRPPRRWAHDRRQPARLLRSDPLLAVEHRLMGCLCDAGRRPKPHRQGRKPRIRVSAAIDALRRHINP